MIQILPINITDHSRRVTHYDGMGGNRSSYNRTCSYHRSLSNLNPWQNRGIGSNRCATTNDRHCKSIGILF